MTGTTGRRREDVVARRADRAVEDGPDQDGASGPADGPRGPGLGTRSVPPRVGDLVVGVRLTARVGRGGSGQVWAGTEEPGGARVAVKLLDRPGAEHEARLLAGLRHPHVLSLRRVSDAPPAVVTDLAEGGSLAAQVEVRGRLSAPEVVTVVAPVADALAFLHGRGVVHGDVSGGNVLFVGRGRPVLADLGSSTLAGAGDASATAGYAAPEVLDGGRPGPASDVHGLGAVAWLALTGGVPPAAGDRLPLRLLAPECPDALVDVVTAALDPDPSLRPTPEDLAGLVRASCPGEAVRLVPQAALGVAPEEAVTFRVRAAARAQETTRRRRPTVSALVAGGLTVLAASVVSALLLLGAPAPPSAGPDPSDGVAPAAGPVPAAPPPPAPGPAPTTGAAPPRGEDLERQVRELVLARQAALTSGDLSALTEVHHADGDTLGRDLALLSAGPVPVTFDVLDVSPVPGRPTAAAVRTRTTSPQGVVVTEEVVLVLAAGRGGWRVLSVER